MRHAHRAGNLRRMVRGWYTVSVTSVVVVLAYLSLFRGNFDHIADDPGLGWHLADGALITSTGRVPVADPFLAPAKVANPYVPVDAPRKWVNDQWLSDVILFNLYSLGGWPLLYGVVAALFLVAYFGILGDGLTKSGQGGILVILATLIAFKVGQVHLIVRPVIFSIFLFPLVLRRVTALMKRVDISWREIGRESMVLCPLFVLWANLHPAFVNGLCVIGLAVLAQALRGRAGRSSAFRWTALGLLCFAVTVCTPNGPALYDSIAQLTGSSYFLSLLMEWYPTDLARPEGMLLMFLAVVPAVCAAILPELRKRVSVFELLVALCFFMQALWAVRHVPFASFACLPLWAACFGGGAVVPKRSVFALTGRVFSRIGEREARSPVNGLTSSVFVALVGLLVVVSRPESVLPSLVGSVHERQLKELFAKVDTSHSEGVVLASLNWGGAIIHLLGPRYKPIVDDRTVVVGEALYRASLESFRRPATFEELFTTFGVTHVLAPSEDDLSWYLRDKRDWTERASLHGTSLFVHQ